jgi:D-alanyl-D-alanine carboxypeptidase/D-alanyl-D-alanine-endopeptidase (penicillin-binding protein 4)
MSAAALLVAAVVLALLGVRAARADERVAASPRASSASPPATPVLSARRLPDLLVKPVALNHLQAALAPVVAQLPTTSCFRVTDGVKTIFDQRGGDAYLPASNLKLLTGFAVLRLLGAGTTFSTNVVSAASPKDGTVAGDLYLVGGGDPLLTTDPYLPTIKYGVPPHTSLEAIADKIVAAGVKHVTGSVKGDESRYDSARTVASWKTGYSNDVGPLSALAINDARAYPAIGPVAGRIRPADDPPTYAASTLTDLLRARGVVVDGPAGAGAAPKGAPALVAQPSLTVGQIVDEMLNWSDNNTAELLVKEVGFEKRGQGSTAAGVGVIRDELTKAGIDQTGLVMTDGSGLDRNDRLSCATITQVLGADGVDGPIAKGLPVAASTGTLQHRYQGSPAASKVKAKTGTLNDANSLSGWVTTDHGLPLVFSILSQTGDVAASRLIDQRLTEVLLGYPDSPDPATVGPEAVASK